MRSFIAKTMALSLGLALCLSGMALASSAELVAAAKKEGKLRMIGFSSYKKPPKGSRRSTASRWRAPMWARRALSAR